MSFGILHLEIFIINNLCIISLLVLIISIVHIVHRWIISMYWIWRLYFKIEFQVKSSFGFTYIFNDLGFVICSLFWPALFCYFATITTDRISSIGNIAYHSDWYEFPSKLRHSIQLIILRSQTPTHFSGWNLFRCNFKFIRKVFWMILNQSFYWICESVFWQIDWKHISSNIFEMWDFIDCFLL